LSLIEVIIETIPLPERSSRTFAALLFVAAFWIRLLAVVVLRGLYEGPNYLHGGGDGPVYSQLGYHLALGEGYIAGSGNPEEGCGHRHGRHLALGEGSIGKLGAPTAFRPPGFPLFLAGIYALAGRYYPLVYLAFCALGALSCVLTYALAREFLFECFARWAGVLSAVYIPHIYFSTLFFSETLFIPCLGAGLWLFVRHLKTGRTWQLAAAGLVLGFAVLVRPSTLLFYPLLGLVLVAKRPRDWRRISTHLVVFTIGFSGPILPWSVRNYAAFGKPIPIATEGGCTFWGGNNDLVLNEPGRYGGWAPFTILPSLDQIRAARDEIECSQIQWRLGLDWVRTHLASMPRLLLFKFCRLWLPELGSPSWKYTSLQVITYTPFLILFVLGGVRSLRDPRCRTIPWAVPHLTILGMVLTALIFYGDARFRDANLPVLMIYASLGLAARGARGVAACDGNDP